MQSLDTPSSSNPYRKELKEVRDQNAFNGNSQVHPSNTNGFDNYNHQSEIVDLGHAVIFNRFRKVERISKILDPPIANPQSDTFETDPFSFAEAYQNNAIPAYLLTTNRLKVRINAQLKDLDQDPLLIYCFNGLSDNTQPQSQLSLNLTMILLQGSNCAPKVLPIMNKLCIQLRQLLQSKDKTMNSVKKGLKVIQSLSECLGVDLDQQLHLIVPPLNQQAFERRVQNQIHQVLSIINENAEDKKETWIKLRKQVPTYNYISLKEQNEYKY